MNLNASMFLKLFKKFKISSEACSKALRRNK